jgi:hypothetical protein
MYLNIDVDMAQAGSLSMYSLRYIYLNNIDVDMAPAGILSDTFSGITGI